MVTIVSLDKEFASSTVFGVEAKVSGARNAAHALDMVLNELSRTGWTVSIERYEGKLNEDGTHEISMF